MFSDHNEDFREISLPASEELKFLDAAMEHTKKIEKELEDSLDILQRLSVKHSETNYLYQISPGSIWKGAEYLRYNVESVINEERQKHDLEQPQQHHKVQEINDDSTCSVSSSFTSMEIINQISNASSRLNIDNGAGGDSEALNQHAVSTAEEVNGVEMDFLHRHSKLDVRKIKVKRGVESALAKVQREKFLSQFRAMKMNNYEFTKINVRTKFGHVLAKKTRVFRRRSL